MQQDISPPVTAILIVDHGSRRAESNQLLHDAARRFEKQSQYSIVEPAHMELAEPSIRQAFDRCVSRGAQRVVVFPWFLSPGRHWTEDIPELVHEAAQQHPNVEWLVTPPFGIHPGLMTAVNDRIDVSVRRFDAERTETQAAGH
jgi:sirohydrochlorin ferrochelatase